MAASRAWSESVPSRSEVGAKSVRSRCQNVVKTHHTMGGTLAKGSDSSSKWSSKLSSKSSSSELEMEFQLEFL